jgi:hypothetical protein
LLILSMMAIFVHAENQGDEQGDHNAVVIPMPAAGQSVSLAVKPGARLRLDFELENVLFSRQEQDLLFDLGGESNTGLILENYFLVEPPPTLEGPDGEVVDVEVQLVLGAIENGNLEDLPATAAGGTPLAGLSVFGWLAKRFDRDTPDPIEATIVATSAQTSTRYNQVSSQLLVSRDSMMVDAATSYETVLRLFMDQEEERQRVGLSIGSGFMLVSAWLKDAQLEHSRAQSHLLMAVDAHQDRFGYRIEAEPVFPVDWGRRHDRGLEETLAKIDEGQRAAARRYWRTVAMEQESLKLYGERLDELGKVRMAYRDQYDIGRREIVELIAISRSIYDVELETLYTEHRLYEAHARLLEITGRLFDGDLQPGIPD